jgi:quercetin dioxygenase-like cupin family protein
MSWVRKFNDAGGAFDWEGIAKKGYASANARGTSVRWLIEPEEHAPRFAIRYFEIDPGGYTPLDRHAHDHGVVVLRGDGQVLLGDETHNISAGDTIYVSPQEVHQFRCVGQDPLGFLCVISAPEGRDQ